MKQTNLETRFWEIDALRGLAIVMMILFHLVYDLDVFDIWIVDRHSSFWPYFRIVIATMFILLVGVSLGLLITLGTWLFSRERFVLFGILHFIGLSIILAYPFLELCFWNLLLGVLLIALGMYLEYARLEG